MIRPARMPACQQIVLDVLVPLKREDLHTSNPGWAYTKQRSENKITSDVPDDDRFIFFGRITR
jgi:hypothetical protein